MKKILVPVDFSEHSEYALQTAATLAKKYNSELVILHMLGLSEAILTKDESQEMFEGIYYLKLAEKRFSDFLDKSYLKGITIETTVQNYIHFNEIDNIAKQFNASLIVMGSHGATGVKEVFVGSNTEKVVRTSTTPVLVVKNKDQDFKMKKVVFACDFNLDFVKPFKEAYHFFKSIDANFQIVYINLPDRFISTQEMKQKAFKFFLNSGINELSGKEDEVVYYNDYTLERGLFSFANDFQADVIALPTHGRRGLAHFFSERIGESIVNHSETPIVTFKI
ncbi:universal stress protein [Lacinutrix sp. MedPE-SW]|uniref:universal stress protein n=1 Tax=Lacinutrix sp. MedPE-SW TaxID=1860087 RepID=UPI00091280B2|nr:universal stress protein [Lacinutrix sp. MedPE-SW]OIQ18758.1 MAG: universal stress protein UspA [Lacinutrix sp. MedPE-SW]